MASGYLVEEFHRLTGKDQSIGVYILTHLKKVENFR